MLVRVPGLSLLYQLRISFTRDSIGVPLSVRLRVSTVELVGHRPVLGTPPLSGLGGRPGVPARGGRPGVGGGRYMRAPAGGCLVPGRSAAGPAGVSPSDAGSAKIGPPEPLTSRFDEPSTGSVHTTRAF